MEKPIQLCITDMIAGTAHCSLVFAIASGSPSAWRGMVMLFGSIAASAVLTTVGICGAGSRRAFAIGGNYPAAVAVILLLVYFGSNLSRMRPVAIRETLFFLSVDLAVPISSLLVMVPVLGFVCVLAVRVTNRDRMANGK